jgi:uncharacterized protein (TIGR00369 family)
MTSPELPAERTDFAYSLGIEVVERRPGAARVVVPLRRDMLNLGGTVHGAIICALIDVAVGIASHSLDPDGTRLPQATTELSVTFLRAGTQGPLSCEARIRRRGRSLSVGEAEVSDGRGRLLAVGRATYLVGGAGPAAETAAADDSLGLPSGG